MAGEPIARNVAANIRESAQIAKANGHQAFALMLMHDEADAILALKTSTPETQTVDRPEPILQADHTPLSIPLKVVRTMPRVPTPPERAKALEEARLLLLRQFEGFTESDCPLRVSNDDSASAYDLSWEDVRVIQSALSASPTGTGEEL